MIVPPIVGANEGFDIILKIIFPMLVTSCHIFCVTDDTAELLPAQYRLCKLSNQFPVIRL